MNLKGTDIKLFFFLDDPVLVDGFSCSHMLMTHELPIPAEFLTLWDVEKISLGSPQIIFYCVIEI